MEINHIHTLQNVINYCNKYINLEMSFLLSLIILGFYYFNVTRTDNTNDQDSLHNPYLTKNKNYIPVSLAERMKYYEDLSKTVIKVNSKQPFAVRLDGRAFSKFTKQFKKYSETHYNVPYSPEFKRAMLLTTHDIIHEYSASCGYTHSDEMTIIFSACVTENSTHNFDGKVIKILTTMSSFATERFNYYMTNEINILKEKLNECITNNYDIIEHLSKPTKVMSVATFDARLIVFPIDKINEIGNLLLWRSKNDCSRNFVSMFAEKYIGKNKLESLNTSQRIEQLINKGYLGFTQDDENLDYSLKFGVFMKRNERSNKILENQQNERKSIATNFYVFKNLLYSSDFVNFLLEPKNYEQYIVSDQMKVSCVKKYNTENINKLLYDVPDYTKKASECKNTNE